MGRVLRDAVLSVKEPHYEDKSVSWPFYPYDEAPCTWKYCLDIETGHRLHCFSSPQSSSTRTNFLWYVALKPLSYRLSDVRKFEIIFTFLWFCDNMIYFLSCCIKIMVISLWYELQLPKKFSKSLSDIFCILQLFIQIHAHTFIYILRKYLYVWPYIRTVSNPFWIPFLSNYISKTITWQISSYSIYSVNVMYTSIIFGIYNVLVSHNYLVGSYIWNIQDILFKCFIWDR